MFVIETTFFDSELLYKAKQSYQMKRVAKNKYIFFDGDKLVLMQQFKNKVALLCSEEEFYSYWFNYFDFKYDYYNAAFKARVFYKHHKNLFLKLKLSSNKDLRILRQDIFTSMIYNALDDNIYKEMNFKAINSLGEKKHNTLQGMSVNWNIFPNYERILECKERLNDFYLNENEKKKIISICEGIKEREFDLSKLKEFNEEVVYILLRNIYYDDKWAKKVMFYSLGYKDCFVLNEKEKDIVKKTNLKPKDFLSFPEIKGLLLEYIKV